MLEQLILDMFDLEMIKFGNFTLKSGKQSNIYIDVRTAISHPKIFITICDLLYAKAVTCEYSLICGIAYSALTFASGIAYAHQVPMILRRKESKEYGTKKIVEGAYKPGDICLILEDVITTGASIVETTQVLEQQGLIVKDVVAFVDREDGGEQKISQYGYRLHSIINFARIIEILKRHNKIQREV